MFFAIRTTLPGEHTIAMDSVRFFMDERELRSLSPGEWYVYEVPSPFEGDPRDLGENFFGVVTLEAGEPAEPRLTAVGPEKVADELERRATSG